jgi:hypothetical protein
MRNHRSPAGIYWRPPELVTNTTTITTTNGGRSAPDADVDAAALGRSVLGLDLNERVEAIGPALRTALKWVADRTVRPVRPPAWPPTPAQRRARTANASRHRLAQEILHACRADPDRDAPLVRALLAARDPQQTGQPLSTTRSVTS